MASSIPPGSRDVPTRGGPGRSARERFDPPVRRCRFALARPLDRAAFLDEVRARSGWDEATVARMLVHGGVHLDGRPHVGERSEGDDAGDALPPRIAAGTRVDLHALAREPEAIPVGPERVLAEGADWVAADKPAGLPVQRTRASRRHSLEGALRALLGCPSLVAVHRLDRETSGVCLFARTPQAAARLGRPFREGAAWKRYLALVPPPPAGATRFETTGWLGRRLHASRYLFALQPAAPGGGGPRPPGWRWSHSRFAVLACDGDRALVAAEPVTGRTHQIRVHLAAAGAPIVGDPVYGGAPAPRLQLHAARLALRGDPGGTIDVAAPLPADLDPAFAALAGAEETIAPTPRESAR